MNEVKCFGVRCQCTGFVSGRVIAGWETCAACPHTKGTHKTKTVKAAVQKRKVS
jgi:hypothetical protein